MSDLQETYDMRAPDGSGAIQISASGDLTQLLEISPDALLIVNPAGTIVMVNEQTETLFGYTRSELQGQSLEMLLPLRFRGMHATHRQHYFSAPRTRPM
jgi:PAS domain S-box-containing protein